MRGPMPPTPGPGRWLHCNMCIVLYRRKGCNPFLDMDNGCLWHGVPLQAQWRQGGCFPGPKKAMTPRKNGRAAGLKVSQTREEMRHLHV